MSIPLDFDRLLSALYEVVLAPDTMGHAMKTLAELFHASDSVITIVDQHSSSVSQEYCWCAPDDDGLYERHFHRIDPRLAAVASRPIGFVTQCEQQFDVHFVRRNEFYNDYLIPIAGVRYSMGGAVAKVGAQVAYLALHRPPFSRGFSDQEVQKLTFLVPHLERSIRLFLEFQRLRGGWSTAAVDSMVAEVQHPLAIVACDGGLHLCNNAFEALVRTNGALQVSRTRVVARFSERDRSDLERAMRDSCVRRTASELLIGMNTKSPLHVRTCPLPTDVNSAGHLRALLTVRDGDTSNSATPQLLQSMHGLTRAESELAHALGKGQTLKQYASSRGVTYGTVRSQLHTIFEKTGVERQSQLVTLVTSSAPKMVPTRCDR